MNEIKFCDHYFYFIDKVLLYSYANQLQKMKYKWVKSERTLLWGENLIHSLADIIITKFWKIIDIHKKVEWELIMYKSLSLNHNCTCNCQKKKKRR